MCGLPGESEADLAGIVEMAETISQLGREVRGRPAQVVANVSNFVPKPQTPYQWNAMQTREYFRRARSYLFDRKKMRSVSLKCHDVESSLLEGIISRGGRAVGQAIELAWRRGARLDGWSDRLRPEVWWQALSDVGVDAEAVLHSERPLDSPLPWGHIGIRRGEAYLRREHQDSLE
jgi:radical SAM superfamily enzyme YgiQ (UPF0313 family)